jgi:hypothetical protein
MGHKESFFQSAKKGTQLPIWTKVAIRFSCAQEQGSPARSSAVKPLQFSGNRSFKNQLPARLCRSR